MAWLKDIPICVVNSHLSMLGPLMAEESRSSATVVGVGHSMQPGEWARRQLASWAEAVRDRGEQRPHVRVPSDAGIKVIRRG